MIRRICDCIARESYIYNELYLTGHLNETNVKICVVSGYENVKIALDNTGNFGGFPITFSFCSLLRNTPAIFQAPFSLSLHLNV